LAVEIFFDFVFDRLIPFLVPDVRQTEVFKGKSQGYPTEGSLWDRYFGHGSKSTRNSNLARKQDPKYRFGTESPPRSRSGGQTHHQARVHENLFDLIFKSSKKLKSDLNYVFAMEMKQFVLGSSPRGI
jgi:hypothetical protein